MVEGSGVAALPDHPETNPRTVVIAPAKHMPASRAESRPLAQLWPAALVLGAAGLLAASPGGPPAEAALAPVDHRRAARFKMPFTVQFFAPWFRHACTRRSSACRSTVFCSLSSGVVVFGSAPIMNRTPAAQPTPTRS